MLCRNCGGAAPTYMRRVILESPYAGPNEMNESYARACLRDSMMRGSTMRATGNLRGWLSFLALRDDKHAQLEIQAYARVVHDLVREQFPRTCALFDEGRT